MLSTCKSKIILQLMFIFTGSLVIDGAVAMTPLDSIAIIVNEDVITKNELAEKTGYFENQIRASGGSVSDR